MTPHDSGKRKVYDTGAVRDTAEGKPDLTGITTAGLFWLLQDAQPSMSHFEIARQHRNFINRSADTFQYELNPERREFGHELIPQIAMNRLAVHLEEGAKKYDARNWEKGMPLSRYYASALRHLIQWANGDISEDHLAAVLFNVSAIIFTEHKILNEELPDELGDLGVLDDLTF